MIRAVLFDLDGTLVDTSAISNLREARRWKDCARAVHRTSLFPGVAELIAELDARGVPWAIVTNVVSNYAEALLKHHSLRCSTLIAYHDVTRHKPHPEGCLRALAVLGVIARNALGIGDLRADQEAFSLAGIRALCAGWNSAAETTAGWSGILEAPQEILDQIE